MQENTWREWLIRRGVHEAVIEEFHLTVGPHAEFGDCIYIPIYNADGTFSFNKYRRHPAQGDVKPKYLYDKGSHATLYGAHKIHDASHVLITEGELDALVAWSHDISAVSSTGGAGTFKEEWAELLTGKDVTVCFDNDGAGAEGMVKVLALLPQASVVFLPDRPGVKDITDYVSNGGNLHELLRSRTHFETVQDVIDDRSLRLSLWQSTHFHDAYIRAHTKPAYVSERKKPAADSTDIEKAKSYPISDLITFNRDHKALCIWHAEKTPSLHYYKKTNTVWCFGGCGNGGDAIDVYRQLHHCSFKEAVNALI